MNKAPKILAIVGGIAGVLVIGLVLGWWGSRAKPVNEPVAAKSNAPAIASLDSNLPSLGKKKARSDFHRKKRTNASSTEVSLNATNATAEWEDKLDEILTTEGNDSDKAKQMLAMFPKLPEDGKEEVAQHLSNLVADEDYVSLGLGKLLTDATLP